MKAPYCTCGPQQELPIIDVPDTWDAYCPTHGEPDQKITENESPHRLYMRNGYRICANCDLKGETTQ